MNGPPLWSDLTPAEQHAWMQRVQLAPVEEQQRLREQLRAKEAAEAADRAKRRVVILDPSLTPDERVQRFAIDRVRHNDASLWAEDGNDIGRFGSFKAEYEHIRRCGTLYVDNITGVDIHTGYCETCAETSYGLRFDAACTCGYRQPGLVWQSGESTWEADDIFDAMDKAFR